MLSKAELNSEYLELLPDIELLRDWVESILNELTNHVSYIHDYQIRIKSPESIRKKLNRYWSSETSIKSQILNLSDLLGARLIFQHSYGVKNFNDQIFDIEGFEISEIQFHDFHDMSVFGEYSKEWQNITKNDKIAQLKRDDQIIHSPNKRGYLGIHYQIIPNFSKTYYLNDEIHTLGHFELQLRTMLQNAWSEVQHYMIYKNKSEYRPERYDAINRELFATSKHLNIIDESISNLFDYTMAPSTNIGELNVPKEFEEFGASILELNKILSQTKNNITKKARDFFAQNIGNFRSLLKNPQEKYSVFYSEIAEFLLRSELIEEANKFYDLTKKFEYFSEYGFLFLRYAEVDLFRGEIDEVQEHITTFRRINENDEASKKLNAQQLRYYYEALRLLWRSNNQDREAIEIGQIILEYLITVDKRDLTFYLLNINYKICANRYTPSPISSDAISQSQSQSLNEVKGFIKPYIDRLLVLENDLELYASDVPNLYYKLAYVKYIIFLINNRGTNLLEEAIEHVSKFWSMASPTDEKYKLKSFELLRLISEQKEKELADLEEE